MLDQRAPLTTPAGDDWLAETATRVGASLGADRVMLETTPAAAVVGDPVLGYFSWGSTDPQLRGRTVDIRFSAGAIAATFSGDDARTLESPPPDWVPMTNPRDQATWFGGSPQGLIGDLVRQGVTGVAGHVAEPLLAGVVRPQVLFPAYLDGYNLIESYYLAMPFLSWQNVVIGDPLSAPFDKLLLESAEAQPAVADATQLPEFFNARRLAILEQTIPVDAELLPLLARTEALMARGDLAGAREALETIVAGTPDQPGPMLQAALLAEQFGDWMAAIPHYQRVLDLQPENFIALNNLAYALSVHQDNPAEGRPLAVQAVEVSNRNVNALDTLGWIEYLLGNHAAAEALLTEAMAGAPTNVDMRVHAATVALAQGDRASANRYLDEAAEMDPAVDDREEVVSLRQQL